MLCMFSHNKKEHWESCAAGRDGGRQGKLGCREAQGEEAEKPPGPERRGAGRGPLVASQSHAWPSRSLHSCRALRSPAGGAGGWLSVPCSEPSLGKAGSSLGAESLRGWFPKPDFRSTRAEPLFSSPGAWRSARHTVQAVNSY